MDVSSDSHRLLLVGGCGYFGHHLIRWLLEEEKKPASSIIVVDQVSPTPAKKHKGVIYHQADITDASAIGKIINEVQPFSIVHAASPSPYLPGLKVFMRVNVDGTRILLDAAIAQQSVKIFVFVSTPAVSHDTVSDLVDANEEKSYVLIPEQKQPYSHSKAVAEELALSYNRKRPDFVVTAIRPSALFGPDEPAVILATVARAKKGQLRWNVGDGKNVMDFTFVDNASLALVLAINALVLVVDPSGPGSMIAENKRVEGEAFIITNDEHRNFWAFFRSIGAAAGYPTDEKQIISIPKGLISPIFGMLERLYWVFTLNSKSPPLRQLELTYSTIDRNFDISKAKERLGYWPRFSIDEGIQLSVAPLILKKDSGGG